MMDKYAYNSTIKHISQNKEKNKEIKYLNKNNFDSNEILDIIIQIKNNSKKLDEFTIQMIRGYVELLLLILEQIKILF
jgi:hypothetical protein